MLLFSYLNNIIHHYFVQFLTEPLIKSNESLVINGTTIVPYDDETVYIPTSESIWDMDYFRLFISHLSDNKASAKNLKVCLEK